MVFFGHAWGCRGDGGQLTLAGGHFVDPDAVEENEVEEGAEGSQPDDYGGDLYCRNCILFLIIKVHL